MAAAAAAAAAEAVAAAAAATAAAAAGAAPAAAAVLENNHALGRPGPVARRSEGVEPRKITSTSIQTWSKKHTKMVQKASRNELKRSQKDKKGGPGDPSGGSRGPFRREVHI